jgi:hypothetical protein
VKEIGYYYIEVFMTLNTKSREEIIKDTDLIIDQINNSSDLEEAVLSIISELGLNDHPENTDTKSKIIEKVARSVEL